MNVLSLFDGISCGQIALERSGISVDNYYASEIEPKPISITMKNYPKTIQLGDVTKLDDTELSKLPKIDLLIGGSPCQNLSRGGNGKGLKGEASKLFWEYVRILKWLKENNNCDIKFLLENVHMSKENERIITKVLDVTPVDINSKLFSAQNRPRLYWTNIEIEEPINTSSNLLDILEVIDTTNYIKRDSLLFDPTISEKSIALVEILNGDVIVKQATKKGYIVANNGDGINLAFPTSKTRRGRVINQKSNTLDCGCESYVYYDNIIRRLTITELERLQTLPDGYTEGVDLNSRKAAIGNGWTVDVIAYILKCMN